MAYMTFLVLFTYTVLVKMAPTPTWQGKYENENKHITTPYRLNFIKKFCFRFHLYATIEVYSIAYITTLGCEKIREIISSEPVAIS